MHSKATTSASNLHSTLVFLFYHFITQLRGRSPEGNIAPSLQVVHRAEYSKAAALRTPDSPLLSSATQTG